MNLEVGMYVRDIHGQIDKIIGFEGALIEFEKDLICGYIDCNDFTKVSFNFIDILEVGDYVNGNPVCIIKEDEHNRKWIYTDSNYKYGYLEEDIKSILTHEQMEQMAYKVGE